MKLLKSIAFYTFVALFVVVEAIVGIVLPVWLGLHFLRWLGWL